jgi:hypothetical protein
MVMVWLGEPSRSVKLSAEKEMAPCGRVPSVNRRGDAAPRDTVHFGNVTGDEETAIGLQGHRGDGRGVISPPREIDHGIEGEISRAVGFEPQE